MGIWTPGPGPTSGDDTYIYDSGAFIQLDGGAGYDTIDLSALSTNAEFGFGPFGPFGFVSTSFTPILIWHSNIERFIGTSYNDTFQVVFNLTTLITLDGAGGSGDLITINSDSGVWINLEASGPEVWTMDRPGLSGGAWRAIAELQNIENLRGGRGSDFLHGDIVGSSGNDFLRGNASNNTFLGGYGDDLLQGRGGADILNGGDGSDTASYADSSAGVRINLSTGVAQNGDAAGDTLISIENLLGSSFSDELTGDAGNNVLDGGAGADILTGLGGHDIYIVDSASDQVIEAPNGGTDTIRTSVTGITIPANVENYERIGTAAYVATGNAQANRFYISALDVDAIATIYGGGGADIVDFSRMTSAVWVGLDYAGAEGWTTDATSLTAGIYRAITDINGVSDIAGSVYNDYLRGDANANRFYYVGGRDTVVGGAGADTIDFTNFGAAVWIDFSLTNETVWTMDRPNLIGGTWRVIGDVAGVENVSATAFDDFFRSGVEANAIFGWFGVDTVSYSNSGAGVTIDLFGNAGSGGTATGDTLTGIENLIGSAFSDTLIGNAIDNTLDGGPGSDTLRGGGGNDTFIVDALDTIIENPGEGSDTVRTALAVYTLPTNVENYQHIGADSYAAIGNASDNRFIFGAIAPNQIATLNGAAGDDIVDFSAFNGAVWVGLTYSGYEGWTTDAATQTGGAYRPIADLNGIESIIGTVYDDIFRGDGNENRYLYTGGVDNFDGAGGVDTIDFSQSPVPIWIDLGLSSNSIWTREDGIFSGGEWRVIGNVSNVENVVGSYGGDLIRGNAADNRIQGGEGNDTLSGGAGADAFVYRGDGSLVWQGHDRITDFTPGIDRIEIDSSQFYTVGGVMLIDNSGADAMISFGYSGFTIAVTGVDISLSDIVFV